MSIEDEYDEVLDESFEFDDDNYDDVSLDDDDEFGHYDDDDGYDHNEEDVVQTSKKKGFSLDFNTMVIIGAVLVGGLVMFNTISSSKPPPKPANQQKFTTALQMGGHFEGPGSIEKGQASPDKKAASADMEGFLFDNSSLDASEEIIEDSPPMPSPIVSAGNEPMVASSMEENIVSENDIIPEVVLEDDIVMLSDDQVRDVIQANPIDENLEDLSMVVVEEQNTAIGLDGTKLDQIILRLESMERKISDIQTKHTGQIEGIKTELKSLRGDGSNIARVSGVSKKKEVRKSSPPQTKKVSTRKKAVSRTVKWELRAAQPGKAWVSQRGNSDMRPVVVGDKLSGIGRIRSIMYQGNKWVVRGDSGQIMQ